MSTPFNTTAVKAGILVILWFVLFSPVALSLLSEWLNQSDNSYGLLVPFISLYFVLDKREQLRGVALSTSSWGAILLIVSLIIYAISLAGDIAFLSRLMMIFSLIGMVFFNFGKDLVRVLIFPLMFLFFMVPVPVSLIEKISIPLKLFASTVSVRLIQLFSIPVYREGNIMYFSQTQLEVAQSCSGLQSIVALTMISVIFVYFLKKGVVRKMILLASAIPIALLANIMRVTLTGILVQFYGSEAARGFLHELSGLVVIFVLGFLVLSLEFFILNKIGTKKCNL